MPTAGRGRPALQESLSTEGRAEHLRERWDQLTGRGRQLQSSVMTERRAVGKLLEMNREYDRFVSPDGTGLTEAQRDRKI